MVSSAGRQTHRKHTETKKKAKQEIHLILIKEKEENK